MKTLLRIDSSARQEGSHSRTLADEIERRWRRASPDARVITRDIARDLAREPIPHLDDATIRAFHASAGGAKSERTSGVETSDRLLDELKAADALLISCPVYNFSIPSTLKAYFDHVVRAGQTFDVTASGFRGRLGQTNAYVVVSRGGTGENGRGDPVVALIETTLRFLGIRSIEPIVIAGTADDEASVRRGMDGVVSRVEELFPTRPAPH